MQNKKLSIRKIVSYLNNDEAEGGGFWLPNIQRPFVWNEQQIVKLFDSIMREYPISTLLVWKTKAEVVHRHFIANYLSSTPLSTYKEMPNTRSKLMVLDGQQRLQSLVIALKGSYEKRELYLDILSGASNAAPDDLRFRFAFKAEANGAVTWPYVRFKDIVFSHHQLDPHIAKDLESRAPQSLSSDEKDILLTNVARARKEFVHDDNITYQELDGIDNPNTYEIDDIVEIFIRANSGGTKLGKSDLMFSLLTSSWDAADGSIEALLGSINATGFDFDRDFVLKCCLVMLGKGARYEVRKFQDGKTKEEIVEKWSELAEAIKAVRDFIVANTYIRSDKGMPSYQALIPLVYLRYHYPTQFKAAAGLSDYLLRVLITGAFGGSPDRLIDKINRRIDENKGFVLSEIYDVIREDGRSLEITPNVILDQGYGTRAIHLLFNLWYKGFDYTPSLDAGGPQIDHIFPQSLLTTVKDPNPETGRMNILHYRAPERDQIANCMLLTAEENGFTQKNDTAPNVWFARSRFESDRAHENYLDMHLIPRDPALWELDKFPDFIAERKALIIEKFSYMLLQTSEVEKSEHEAVA